MATAEFNAELNKRKTALCAFVVSLMASAKTSGLYKAGHPMLQQIAERMVNLLIHTMGSETTLTAAVKAKVVELDDSPLEEKPEITLFASALHMLGVGGVTFTNRISSDGMHEFFKVLIAKPDESHTLSDLQKRVQGLRIDGLTMTFILNFVVTGESDEVSQAPGRLSEEQILAYLQARTLPDFIALLLKQNETLTSKEAENITAMYDGLLYREISLETFEEEMPWSFYDERLKERWDYFRSHMGWSPKRRDPAAPKQSRQRWESFALESWCSTASQRDIEVWQDHKIHERSESLGFALDKIHGLMDDPIAESQLKFSILCYSRVLADIGRGGDFQVLFREFDRFQPMAEDPGRAAHYENLRSQLRQKLVTPLFAGQLAGQLAGLESDSDEFNKIHDFIVFLGEGMMPLLIDASRSVTEKPHQALLSHLIALLSKPFGLKPILDGLADDDWFLVVNLIGVLAEIADPANTQHVAPLLKRTHRRIRDATAKFLYRFGGDFAVDALAEYVGASKYPEELPTVIIKFSQMRHPKLAQKFMEAFGKTTEYGVKVSLITALGRLSSPASVSLLKDMARRTWYEMFTGLNKELRGAAKHSLAQLKKEGHA